MAAQKVNRETCLSDFERFAKAMRLRIDVDAMTPEVREEFEEARAPLIEAMQDGVLVIDDKGRAVFTPEEQVKGIARFVFQKPTGATLKAMDTEKAGKDVGKMFAVLAQLTEQDASVFNKMDYGDFQICQAIITLFLAPRR